ncbi:hypothetical protein [Phreatobacter sp.]|uniref:hypothetical protein n=1 Tax=Phreatobacter sp. TaxID=1966341 RepID=UPI0022C0C800|nr:hypothetical protein [Phreatobacter sp.]MCZ8313975.1 hypothetical protein [Phreatobacter sp.]
MASLQQGNVVALFGEDRGPSLDPASPILVVRAMADATAALGRAAALIDSGELDPDRKLALIRGIQDLVVRSFDVNTRFMQAARLTR